VTDTFSLRSIARGWLDRATSKKGYFDQLIDPLWNSNIEVVVAFGRSRSIWKSVTELHQSHSFCRRNSKSSTIQTRLPAIFRGVDQETPSTTGHDLIKSSSRLSSFRMPANLFATTCAASWFQSYEPHGSELFTGHHHIGCGLPRQVRPTSLTNCADFNDIRFRFRLNPGPERSMVDGSNSNASVVRAKFATRFR